MEKTKIFALTAAIAVFVALVTMVGASYVQTVNGQNVVSNVGSYRVPQSAGTYGACGFGGSTCPRLGGTYAYGGPQSGYSYGMGIRDGMMGGYYR
jgi:hypothetical protein